MSQADVAPPTVAACRREFDRARIERLRRDCFRIPRLRGRRGLDET